MSGRTVTMRDQAQLFSQITPVDVKAQTGILLLTENN
jgi:hypothetical protein